MIELSAEARKAYEVMIANLETVSQEEQEGAGGGAIRRTFWNWRARVQYVLNKDLKIAWSYCFCMQYCHFIILLVNYSFKLLY